MPLRSGLFGSKQNLYHQKPSEELDPCESKGALTKFSKIWSKLFPHSSTRVVDSFHLRLWTQGNKHFHKRFEVDRRIRCYVVQGDQYHLLSVQYYSRILGIHNILKEIQSFIINSIVFSRKQIKNTDICQNFDAL